VIEYLIAIFFAALALWLAFFKAEQWRNKSKVLARISANNAATSNEIVREDSFEQLALVSKLLSSPLLKGDYEELLPFLKVTGKNISELQINYLIICWIVPSVASVLGAIFWGVGGAFLAAVVFFIGARRYIRSIGVRAKATQNLEAIEFAQTMRMLLEAGLSIERAIRITAIQAKPLMPMLVYRLERFNRLMDSGVDRSAALDDIGGDREIPVLYNLTRLLKQSGVLGGAITESITQVIEEAHLLQASRIKEQVNKLGAKMTLVMMTLMFPALFVIIGGPAGYNIMQGLSQ